MSIFTMFLLLVVTLASLASAQSTAVNLGAAGNFVISAKTGVSTTGTTHITGDIGVSPAQASALTGFAIVADSSNVFATSTLVTGHLYAADCLL